MPSLHDNRNNDNAQHSAEIILVPERAFPDQVCMVGLGRALLYVLL